MQELNNALQGDCRGRVFLQFTHSSLTKITVTSVDIVVLDKVGHNFSTPFRYMYNEAYLVRL